MTLYASGSHVLGASASLLSTGLSGGNNFTSASGFTISSPSGISNGSLVTVNASSGSPFGTKPYAAAPLLWAPFDTTVNPSSLGRITTWLGNPAGNIGTTLSWQSSGGPGGVGCLASTVATGAAGVWNWSQGIDLPQWSGWAAADPFGGGNGYFANDFGASTYRYNRVNHTFGHLDETAGNSYNSIGGYNVKDFRDWSTDPIAQVNATQNQPDIYNPTSTQIFAFEGQTGLATPPFQDYPGGGGSGQGAVTTAAVIAAENITNTWYAQEKMTTSNSNNANYDADFMWRVPASPTQGPFLNGSFYQFPTLIYHQIGFQFCNTSSGNSQTLGGNVRGTITRLYPIHYIIDGTSGSHTAAPTGAQYFWSQVYCDDSMCRVVATNSSTWGAETDLQIQIPTSWATASVQFSTYNIPLNWYVYIVNASNSATYVGQRTS